MGIVDTTTLVDVEFPASLKAVHHRHAQNELVDVAIAAQRDIYSRRNISSRVLMASKNTDSKRCAYNKGSDTEQRFIKKKKKTQLMIPRS
jgi:hypothetical protein